MSFLIDAPWLYANGRAIAAVSGDDAPKARRLGVATTALFWGISIPMYLEQRWTRPIWRACRARSGRDWMVNSGVLRLDPDRGRAVHAAIFATYPLWLWLGYKHKRT